MLYNDKSLACHIEFKRHDTVKIRNWIYLDFSLNNLSKCCVFNLEMINQ